MTSPIISTHVMDQGVWRSTTPGVEDIGVTEPPTGGTTPARYGGSGVQAAGTGAITVQWPAGHRVGDIGLLAVQTSNQNLPATPSGWTYVTGYPVGVGTAGASPSTMAHWLWKRASSSAEPSVAIGDSGNHTAAIIHLVSGALESGDPINVAATPTTVGSASTAVTIPGATTTVDNCLVVLFVANSLDTLTAPTTGATGSWVNASLISKQAINPLQTTQLNGGGIGAIVGVMESAGAYGSTTTTLTTASLQVRGSFALAPAIGSGGNDPSGLATYLGVSELPQANWGTFVFGDVLYGDRVGGNWTSTSGIIDDLVAAGAKAVMRVTPGNAYFKNPSAGTTRINSGGHAVPYDPAYPVGAFLPYVWEFYWDEWFAAAVAVSGGDAKLRTAFTNGTLTWLQLIDDVGSTSGWQTGNAFSRLLTFAEFERIAAHAKEDMPYCPMGVRTSPTFLAGRAPSGSSYRSVDLAVATFVPTRSDHWDGTQATSDQWIASEVSVAASKSLAVAGAMNLARGWWYNHANSTDLTEGWSCYAVTADFCGISPKEMLQGGSAILNATRNGQSAVAGINVWSWEFGGDSYLQSTRTDDAGRSIPSVMATLKDLASTRDEGPKSLHSLPAP